MRRRGIDRTLEHYKKKIANGGRNTDQTKVHFEKVLQELENVQAEYTSIGTALHEAQSYLEGLVPHILKRMLADL